MIEGGLFKGRTLDFVTISYEQEIFILELQFRSMHKFLSPKGLGRIYVVWNTLESTQTVKNKYEMRLKQALWSHADRLVLMSAKDVYDSPHLNGVGGSFTQQFFKLTISRYCRSEFYCILDSKNHFIRAVDPADFFDPRGYPRTQKIHYPKGGRFYDRAVFSFSYFGVDDVDTATENAMPTITPYVMKRDRVSSMIDEVVHREGVDFAEAFLSDAYLGGKTTEFLLYGAYIASSGSIEDQYAFSEAMHVTFFSKAPASEKIARKAIASLDSQHIAMFAVHNDRFRRLTKDQKQAFAKIWVDRGLFPTIETANQFIEHHRKMAKARADGKVLQ